MPEPTKVAQVRRLNYNGEELGMGFNSDTGLSIGTALNFSLPIDDIAQEAVSDVSIVTSHEELMSKLNMNAKLEGRYSIFSGSLKTDFSKTTTYNSNSTFVVARMVIQNTIHRGKNFAIKPELKALHETQPEVFDKAFGDCFVRAHYKGGEFYAVMRLTSIDSKTETDLAITLRTEVQAGVAGGKFDGEIKKHELEANTRSEFSVHFYQKGGAGKEEIGTTLDVEEIKKRLRSFPDAVRAHAFPYFIEVATYDTIPLAVQTKQQEEEFLFALDDADAKKLRYLQIRNDCDLAAESPEFFSDPPSLKSLREASAVYTRLLGALLAHAAAVSKGSIPPRPFDPASLTPPIIEPEVVLRKKDVGLVAQFANLWVTKDGAATLQSDRVFVKHIGSLAKKQFNDFGGIVDPNGDPAQTLQLQGNALAKAVASFKRYSLDDGTGDSFVDFRTRKFITSVSTLSVMLPKSIKLLGLADAAIESTKGLDAFAALVTLSLNRNKIGSIEELGSLTALRDLSLSFNHISDLGPLRGCASLESLEISGNAIADLTPLASCKALKNLTLSGDIFSENGVDRPNGNPIVNALALNQIPGMASPFTGGKVLTVRVGVLRDGPAAQFTGTATRVGDSRDFRAHLTRGDGEVRDELWTVDSIIDADPLLSEPNQLAIFAPGSVRADFPSKVRLVRIHGVGFCLVDPLNPNQASINDIVPVAAAKMFFPTVDATVVQPVGTIDSNPELLNDYNDYGRTTMNRTRIVGERVV